MPRDAKTEVSAINLRINKHDKRDYLGLVQCIFKNKISINVHGESFIIISNFNAETGFGVLSKYTDVSNNRYWFDIENLDIASDDDVEDIYIPDRFKANLTQFYFRLVADIHTLIFECYASSKGLSINSVRKFFSMATADSRVESRYGYVEVSVVNSFQKIQEVFSQGNIREINIKVFKPNPDGIDETLAAIIEDRMRETNAHEYHEGIKAKKDEFLKPSQRTIGLANIAAENGEVELKSVVGGVNTVYKSSQTPLKEFQKHKSDEYERTIFEKLSEKIARTIRRARGRSDGQ